MHTIGADLVLNVCIKGHLAKGLIDTGASVTAVRQGMLQKIMGDNLELNPADKTNISSANGTPMEVLGSKDI